MLPVPPRVPLRRVGTEEGSQIRRCVRSLWQRCATHWGQLLLRSILVLRILWEPCLWQFGRSFKSLREMLSFGWARDMHQRSAGIGRSLRVAQCETSREHGITGLLYIPASREDSALIFGSPSERKALVCMDEKRYLGYLFGLTQTTSLCCVRYSS
jgi:hypothetical protein